MGDIAFLLIIFFIVCSNFAREVGIRIQPPRSADIDLVGEGRITVLIDEDGVIYLNGQKAGSPQAVEASVSELVEGKGTPKERMVVFKCDRDVDKAVFEPVLDAIARAGGTIVAVGEEGRQRIEESHDGR
jgi:biopolymer transport protein ExbD